MTNDHDFVASLENFVISFNFIKYFLKSKSCVKSKNFKFCKYTHLFCKFHLKNEFKIDLCFNIDFTFFLTSKNIINKHYSKKSIFIMIHEQRIRCEDVDNCPEFNWYINLLIRVLTSSDDYVIMINEFHIMKDLFCDLVIETNFMKYFDIFSRWRKNDNSDTIFIQDCHEVIVIAIKNDFFKTRKVNDFVLLISFSVKSKLIKTFHRKYINVYVAKVVLLEKKHERNIIINHKFLTTKNYVFEFFKKQDVFLDHYFTNIHDLMIHEINFIFMINFKCVCVKISQDQFLKRFIQLQISLKFVSIDFDIEKVLLKKTKILKNEIFKNENFFIIKNSNVAIENEKLDINHHWRLKFRKQINKILHNYRTLFRTKLK